MSAASQRMRDRAAGSQPRHKPAQLSPELAEVLKMLKALEEQPEEDAPASHDKPR